MRTSGIALVAVFLAACSSGGKSNAGKSVPTSSTRLGVAITGSTVPNVQPFTLEEGFEHDVCGIGVTVKFIPATATSSSADEPVLQGGPISNVQDNVQDHTGDQPLPANAAKLTNGATVTVDGKQFKVVSIDTANTKVGLVPLC
jgi:hypothetical protein